jgi:hypothetical protein
MRRGEERRGKKGRRERGGERRRERKKIVTKYSIVMPFTDGTWVTKAIKR